MEKIKKLFGEIDLSWKKLIIFAIIVGVYTGVMAMLQIAKDTSFADITISFEVWILFGIFIIMNSKSAKDSALKCFVFFLISQPLVYLIQDAVNKSNLFVTYYRYWFMWTIATIPMGFIGYYMKKDKWWGLLILTPILILLGEEFGGYLSKTMFSFPRHLLTTIFCLATLVIYPLVIFKNKKIKIIGEIISGIIIVGISVLCFINPPVYSTDILSSGENYQFDDTYKVYLTDSKYGDLKIKYEDVIECWMLHANFKKAGKTQVVLEAPNGEKNIFDITIARNTYQINEKETIKKENSKNKDVAIDNTWKTENVNITVKEDSITKTSATIVIEDKNEKTVSWGMTFAIQKAGNNNIWVDMIAKETITWVEIAIQPNENGITEMQIDWSKIYGELNKGTYRVIKYNGLSTLYSEPFIIK